MRKCKRNPREDKIVEGWKIEDHGIEHDQYFQGCGTAFTKYDDVAVGIGDNFQEALSDALESLAQSGRWDVDDLEAKICKENKWSSLEKAPTHPSVFEHIREYATEEEIEEEGAGEGLYYYVCVYVR